MERYLVALICVSALAAEFAAASSNSIVWRDYKRKYGKNYQGEEDRMRFTHFLATKKIVDRHNVDSSSSFRMQLNHMADWSGEEFQRLSGSKLARDKIWSKRTARAARLSVKRDKPVVGPLPDDLDWRKVPNRVSNVKDQGQCNSGWAFAATGVLEGQQAVAKISKLIPLSEQQLVDCATSNSGCGPGTVIEALNQTNVMGGIESEEDYKYEAKVGQCRINKKFVMIPTEVYNLLPGDEQWMKRYLVQYGPVAVAIQVTENLKNYHSGVLDDPDCDPDLANHYVLIVGYGRDSNGLDYWLIKNSWGVNWGDGGYFKLRRGVNMCGVANDPSCPDVKAIQRAEPR